MELITEITVPTADVAKVNRMVGHVEDVNKARGPGHAQEG